jgi:hypothetical protein
MSIWMKMRLRVRAILLKPIFPTRVPTVVRVAAAVILGAATTVAVAWSLAWLVDGGQTTSPRWQRGFKSDVADQIIPTPPYSPQQDGVHLVQVKRTWRWGTDIVEVWPAWSEDPSYQPYGSPRALVDGTSFAAEMKERFDRLEEPCAWWRADGWPLLALSAEARWVSYDALGVSRVVGGVLVGSENVFPHDGVRILPLQPIWSGLVINTALYTSLWFALFSLGDIRSGFRRRRGQCVRCGYKLLSVQTRCSECGKAV